MKASKLTSKYQTTIPAAVRQFLSLSQGDAVTFEIENNQVIVRKMTPLDLEYAAALSDTLNEWASAEDDAAYAHL